VEVEGSVVVVEAAVAVTEAAAVAV